MSRPASSAQKKRDDLRAKGQFWTPAWVAEAMVGYLVASGCEQLFDPAVGAGAFFLAAQRLARETGRTLHLLGTELDSVVLRQAASAGVQWENLESVEIRDFVLNPPSATFDGIVANPPYIRHHRLSPSIKKKVREIGKRAIGKPLDGRAGLHVYFLINALRLLKPGGRLAFIMPADTCEGVFALDLWQWITQNYRLDAVVTFDPSATPFPGVDTNPVIFMLANEETREDFLWARCHRPHTAHLKQWVLSGFSSLHSDLTVYRRTVTDALRVGLSRFPRPQLIASGGSFTLGDYARVLRGIATGANEYFFLTRAQASFHEIPPAFLLAAVGRTRDVPMTEITTETMERLNAMGRPTLLFAPDGRPVEAFPDSVQRYLRLGVEMGVHRRALISTRKPWYKMERRTPPPILFAYLGRRNVRFIRNAAKVVPLTSFLCVYPKSNDGELVDKLFRVLQDERTLANLSLVGKSYGNGAIKVEPRALESLPLPSDVVRSVGLPEPVIVRRQQRLPL